MDESPGNIDISIVIPNWNGLHLLKQSLDSVMAAVNAYDGNCEVIVVDNGSHDRSVDVLHDYYPEVKVFPLGTNTGFGYACNYGANEATFDHVLFLNNDIYIPVDFLRRMADTFIRYPNCFSVSPQTNYWRGRELSDDVFSSCINFSFDENGEVIQHWAVNDYANLAQGDELTVYGTGAALLVDKYKFESLGGFDPIYGLAYWEDVALCMQAWRRGWKSYYTNSVVAWHKISATSESVNICNKFKSRMMTINYIIFHLANITESKLTVKFLMKVIRYLRSLQKSGDSETARFIVMRLLRDVLQILKRRICTSRTSTHSTLEVISMISIYENGWKSAPTLKLG